MTQSKLILSFVAALIVISGGAFYGGMRYATGAENPTTFQRPQGGGGNRAMFMGGQMQGGLQGRNAGGFATGEIISKDANSLTLKLNDGGSKIIFYSSSTTFGKMATTSIEEVTPGTNVTVMGTSNSDGSVSATNVQIRPEGQGFERPMILMQDRP